MIYNLALLAIAGFFIVTMIVRDEITGRIKFRLYRSMIVLGLIFIVLRFTPWANGDRTLFIGIPLLIVGLILWNRRRRATDRYFKRSKANLMDVIERQDQLKRARRAARRK